jgi:hypothetical protein
MHSRKYAIAISPVLIGVGPSGRGRGLLGTPKVCVLGTRVAWFGCKPLRLDTAELPENFRNSS